MQLKISRKADTMRQYLFGAMGSLLLISLVTLPVFAQETCSSWKNLRVSGEPQETASWCSVATVWNVTDFIHKKNTGSGQPLPQCQIVEDTVKIEERKTGTSRPDTCCDPPNSTTGRPGKLRYECQKTRWPEAFLDTLSFSYRPPFQPAGETKLNFVRLTWPLATNEICEDRPYISVIGPSEDQTHAVVTHGFFEQSVDIGGRPWTERTVLVYDPFTDESYSDDWRYARANDRTPSVPIAFGDSHFGDTYDIRP